MFQKNWPTPQTPDTHLYCETSKFTMKTFATKIWNMYHFGENISDIGGTEHFFGPSQ